MDMTVDHEKQQFNIDKMWIAAGGENPYKGHKNFQELFDSLSEADRQVAFSKSGNRISIVCMDERIDEAYLTVLGDYARIPGGGILNSSSTFDKLKQVWDKVVVMSHAECGAAGLKARVESFTGNIDDYADRQAQATSMENKVDYGGRAPLNREFHDAIGLYISYLAIFKDAVLKSQIPTGFVISGYYYPDAQTLGAHAKVGYDIFMSHGFGEYDKGPFRVVLLMPNEVEKRQREDEMIRSFQGQKNVVIESVVINNGKY